MHKNDIMEWLLDELKDFSLRIYKFSLVCSERELERRMLSDRRSMDDIKESLLRNKLYYCKDTIKIDLTEYHNYDII